MQIFIYLVILAMAVFVLTGLVFIILRIYDYYLIKKEIMRRKNIGNFSTKNEWLQLVLKRTSEWVTKMPQVQISDNAYFVLLEKLKGSFTNQELSAWQKGGLLLGLGEYIGSKPNDSRVRDQISMSLKQLFNENKEWRIEPNQVDYAILAYAMMKLPQYDSSYKKAMDQVVDEIIKRCSEDGTVSYRSSIPRYRLVDTVGMICPFLIRYGQEEHRDDLVDLGIKQIETFRKYGIHAASHLPAHGYELATKTPIGIFGWGRGVGWYCLGIIDAYVELSNSHPYKKVLKEEILQVAEMLKRFQRTDGGWGHSFLMEQNIYDSSATAMITYFLKKAESIGILDRGLYEFIIEKAEIRLIQSTRKDGVVDFSQGDTKGIGIYSTRFGPFPFTQGITLRLESLRVEAEKNLLSSEGI